MINVFRCVALLGVLAVCAVGQATSREKLEADRLWEQIVEIRGGRKKLHSINNLLLTKGADVPNVQTEFYVYPDRYWEWSKGQIVQPYSFVMTANLEQGWYLTANETGIIRERRFAAGGGGANFSEDWLTDACIFLLETKWLKPAPLRVTRQTVGKERFDVLQTSFPDLVSLKGWLLNYYIEPESLVVRGAALYSSKSDRVPSFHVFDGYTVVDGISVPRTYSVVSRIETPKKSTFVPLLFRFNVRYDEKLFERPPSVSAGPDAWKAAP